MFMELLCGLNTQLENIMLCLMITIAVAVLWFVSRNLRGNLGQKCSKHTQRDDHVLSVATRLARFITDTALINISM